MKQNLWLFLLWAAVFSATSHNKDGKHEEMPLDVLALTERNNDFAMTLYKEIAGSHDHNIFFSPPCLASALAMLSLGAGGKTYSQILKALNLHQLKDAEQPYLIPELFLNLKRNLSSNPDLVINQDSSIFASSSMELQEGFVNDTKEYFGAEVLKVNFSESQNAKAEINQYVSKMTQGRIEALLDSVDPQTKLMMLNSIFFKGKWKQPFNASDTEESRFYVNKYKVVRVPMMYKSDRFQMAYDSTLKLIILKLPYRGNAAMLVLLPEKDVDHDSIDEEISAKHLTGWLKKLKSIKLEVFLPRFKLEQSYKMHKILPRLGITDMFTELADLSHIADNRHLKVSEVIHKSSLEVDERGTEAASATATGITGYSLPPTFKVDRPFLFLIYHEITNCLLFMGRVVDPTEK
uniref:Serpin peptidase inhibitor, clade A (alpha-1 antiproteinase, antitrypsin), member 10b n=2 Tax=Erpetoichthys calabaricus TaxID=27687 RepID=A0A8C4SQP1_ERPCA